MISTALLLLISPVLFVCLILVFILRAIELLFSPIVYICSGNFISYDPSALLDVSLLLLISPLLLTIVLLAFILKVIELLLSPFLYLLTWVTLSIPCLNQPKSIVLEQSLEPWFLFILRVFLRLLPIWPIRKITYLLRCIFKILFSTGKFSMKHKSKHIDQITYSSHNDNSINDSTFIIIIHGGGFSLCDNGDVSVLDRLLPQLDKELSGSGIGVPYVFSITYDTASISGSNTLFQKVQSEALKAYDDIKRFASGKQLVGMIGDSAGGNLVLSLVIQLQDRGEDLSKVRLCLASPWVDLYSKTVAYEENRKSDMLTAAWLACSRAHYVGNKLEAALLPAMATHQLHTMARELTRELLFKGTRVVIFDMDQCLVNAHSRGQLKRSELSAFAAKVRPDFIAACCELHKAGLNLAVATHSDAEEYAVNKRSETDYIMGDELVHAVLRVAIPELAALFTVVAYNPRVRGNQDPNDAHKRLHVRKIAEQLVGVAQKDCVLFDDDPENATDTGGLFSAYKVDERTGFDLSQAVLSVRADSPISSPTPPLASASPGKAGAVNIDGASTSAVRPPAVSFLIPFDPADQPSPSFLEEVQAAGPETITALSQLSMSKSGTGVDVTNVDVGVERDERQGQGQQLQQQQQLESWEEQAYAVSREELQRVLTATLVGTGPIAADMAPAQTRAEGPTIETLCPLFASQKQLARLPPCLVSAGGWELFRDDAANFFVRLRRARQAGQTGAAASGASAGQLPNPSDPTLEVGATDIAPQWGAEGTLFGLGSSLPGIGAASEFFRSSSFGGLFDLHAESTARAPQPGLKPSDSQLTGGYVAVSSVASAPPSAQDINAYSSPAVTIISTTKGPSLTALPEDRLIFARRDMHASTLMWRHLIHRVFAPLGLASYFYCVFPTRQQWEQQEEVDGKMVTIPVHSPQADALIKEMAKFLAQGIKGGINQV